MTRAQIYAEVPQHHLYHTKTVYHISVFFWHHAWSHMLSVAILNNIGHPAPSFIYCLPFHVTGNSARRRKTGL